MNNDKKQFIFCSADFSGLGFAIRAQEEGNDVIMAIKPKDDEDGLNFKFVGKGLIEKQLLTKVLINKKQYKDAYWIFDMNFSSDVGEMLRKEGFKVFGGDEFSDRMEHDRNFAVDTVHKAGIKTPETYEFNDIKSGIDFLEQNEECAYVFKPDDPDNEAWITTVPHNDIPEKANEEIREFLEAMGDGKGTYILQERKLGVEINVECFVYKGKPFFSHMNFESKRKENGDLGVLIGCSQDSEHILQLNAPILRETIYKLLKLSEYKDYTGFVDGNFIVSDNEFWYLEACQRFGYCSHPNLLWTLAISPMSKILADIIDGKIENFYRHFRQGWGTSILLRRDCPVKGLPLMIPEEILKHYYHYDSYQENNKLYLAGYSQEIGIITAHDYDLKSSADEALRSFHKIFFPGKGGRTDISQTDYQSNFIERLEAIKEMKLI